MKKRIALLSCLFTALCAGLFFRVFQLTINTPSSELAAQKQRQYTLIADRSRGQIYDCNLLPLTGRGRYLLAASDGSLSANAALRAKGIAVDKTGLPFLTAVDEPLYSENITLLSCVERYEDPLAVHVVGHLDGDGNGALGIERAYNDLLSRLSGNLSVRYTVDAFYRTLQTVTPQIVADGYNTAEGLVLTIDRAIQEIVEEEAASITRGAVVVVDVATGAIKASLSLPTFDPNNVAKDLDNPLSPFINRAFSEYAVGSTFKLAVAALALENGYTPAHSHTCEGWVNVSGQVFTCQNHALPQTLDMTEALAVSCNTYFIDLAQKLSANRLVGFAGLLGFGSSNVLAENMVSAAGVVPSLTDLQNPAELANFGFGQGKLSATPLQIASLIATIANDGVCQPLYLVEGQTDGETLIKPTARPSGQRVMRASTARTLRLMMINVVENGSGTRAKPAEGGAGGKTASAQTGIPNEDGEERVDAWFSGFYPADKPRYALVIVNEGANSGSRQAAPIFKAICDRIAVLEKYGR